MNSTARNFRGSRIRRLAACCAILAACAPGRAAAPGAATHVAPAPGDLPELLVRVDLQRLSEAGLDRRTAPLTEALKSHDPAVRATAAHALGSVQDPAALGSLTALLADADARVRLESAFALGQLGDAADAGPLLAASRIESDAVVRVALLEAIGKVGGADALEAMLAIDGPERPAEKGLGIALALYHFARRGVTHSGAGARLLDLVVSEREQVATTSALALAAARGPLPWGVDGTALRSVIDRMRRDRLAAGPLLGLLGRDGNADDLDRLASWLGDATRWQTRVAAAEALGRLADPTHPHAVLALSDALTDPSVHVATTAAEALARLADASDALAMERLAAWIRDPAARPSVRAALLPGLVGSAAEEVIFNWARGELGAGAPASLAWGALVRTGSSQAEAILLAALRGERRDAYAAATALADRLATVPAEAELRDTLIPVLVDRLPAWGPHAPGSDLRGLLRLIRDLTRTRPGSVVALLSAAARHPHPEVRAVAAGGDDPTRRGSEGPTPRLGVDWALLREAGARPRLEFTTDRGSFIVELHPEAAPLAVSSLLAWAEMGRFDDLTFHRVEADFILQSGDFPNALGYGGPDLGLRSEFTRIRYAPGVLGIASAGKDTEGSQFFITHGYSPSLDGRYGAVGRVVSGLAVAEGVGLGDRLISVVTMDWPPRPDPAGGR